MGLVRDWFLRTRRVYRAVQTVRMQNYILALLFTAVGARAELSRLEALSMIESGDNDAAVGQAGEVSRFQIKPSVWAHYSGSRAFRDCRVARQVAVRHLGELTTWFQQHAGRPATDFDVYVLWNAGPTYYTKIGYKTTRVHPVVGERARRFVRLTASAPARRVEIAVAPVRQIQRETVPPPKAASIAPLPVRDSLWPVFEQPAALLHPVPAFALTPWMTPVAEPRPSTGPRLSLGTIVLVPGE